jgi:hypothetical protein
MDRNRKKETKGEKQKEIRIDRNGKKDKWAETERKTQKGQKDKWTETERKRPKDRKRKR